MLPNGRCWQMLDRNGARTASRSQALLRQPSSVRPRSITALRAPERRSARTRADRQLAATGKPLPNLLSGTRPSLLGDVDRRADSRRHGRRSLRHRSSCSARWRGSSPRSRCSTMKRPSVVGSTRSTARLPKSTRPWWRGRRRASARWTSIRSWRVGGGPAPPILSSSPVSRPPRSDEARSSDSRSSHCPGESVSFKLRPYGGENVRYCSGSRTPA